MWVVHSTILRHSLRKLKPEMTFSMQYIVFLFEYSSSHHSWRWGREQRASGLSVFLLFFFLFALHYFYLFRILFYLSVVALQFLVVSTVQQNELARHMCISHPLWISFPSRSEDLQEFGVGYSMFSFVIYLIHSINSVYASGLSFKNCFSWALTFCQPFFSLFLGC